jgi:hypothetical protein
MKALSLETNRRGHSVVLAKELTLQETQGLKMYILTALAIFAAISLIGYIVVSQVKIRSLEAENASLSEQVSGYDDEQTQTKAKYNSTVNLLKSNIKAQNSVIESLDSQAKSLVQDNKNLAAQYDKVMGKYKVLAKRKELYDKYQYVVMYSGKRTDVTYSQIKTAAQLMQEKGYDPNILFSTIMVESRGNSKAANSSSSALGYGQFLRGTGKYTYETLLGNGKNTYNHSSMALNGSINIKMMAAYLSHLMDKYDGNIFYAMRNYCGKSNSGTQAYLSWMNNFTKTVGINVYSLSKS